MPSSGGRSAGDRPQQRRLAGAVGPDDADPLPALRGEERRGRHGHGLRRLGTVGRHGPAARQVPHREVLEPDDQLARAHRPARERLAVEPQRARRLARRDDLLGPQLLEARLVLVHLHVLALAAVALDELHLALDRARLGLGLLLGAEVTLHALPVVRAVVAAEHRQAAVAELPDAGDGRVEERPVVRGDQQRAGAPAQVLLEPLDGVDVEVVRGLVQHEQVRVGDDEPGEGRPGLLAARERRRRAQPLVPREPEARERLVDPLVQRVAAKDVEPVLEVRVPGPGGVPVVLEPLQLDGHRLEVRGAVADGCPQVRRRHERLVEVRLLAQQPEAQSSPPGHGAAVGLVAAGHDPQQRRLAGAVGADEADPLAGGDGGVDAVEDDEGADLADDPLEAHEAHAPDSGPGRGDPAPRPRAGPPPAGPPRPPSCAPLARGPAPPRRSCVPGPPRRPAPPSAGRAARTSPARAAASSWRGASPCPPPPGRPRGAAGRTSRNASPGCR